MNVTYIKKDSQKNYNATEEYKKVNKFFNLSLLYLTTVTSHLT